jgi:hypothetical protein
VLHPVLVRHQARRLRLRQRQRTASKVNRLPGVDVMITIFCDIWQFLAKKWRFSQKTMLWSQFLQKTSSSFRKKRQYFLLIFRRKYLKIITSVLGRYVG